MKKTVGLIRLLEKNSTPELVVKYIYKNVFELIKESIHSIKNSDIFDELSWTYADYHDIVIKQSEEEWPKTILPPYIHGYRNLYRGVAGRLAFFSADISLIKNLIDVPDMTKDKASAILMDTPDTYYWYGNPDNWSYCYEIKLNESKELVIRKRQIFVVDSKIDVYDEIEERNEEDLNIRRVLMIYKQDPEMVPEDQPDYFPTRTCHVNDKEYISKIFKSYKLNVNLKNGYSKEIQELWTEYNNINNKYQRKLFLHTNKYLSNYKMLDEKKINELKIEFISEYKKKLIKIKDNIDSYIESLEENRGEYLSVEFAELKKTINKILLK